MGCSRLRTHSRERDIPPFGFSSKLSNSKEVDSARPGPRPGTPLALGAPGNTLQEKPAMFSNRLAFAALAVACIGAAAGGGYLASRQAATSTAASSITATPLAGSPLTPVQETEAVV